MSPVTVFFRTLVRASAMFLGAAAMFPASAPRVARGVARHGRRRSARSLRGGDRRV